MLKELTIVFAMFIAVAMTQTQTSQLTTLIGQQVSALVNRLASSNSTLAPVSLSTLAACGLDLGCIVTNLLILILLNPLIYGLRGVLGLVVFLVRFLLLVVQFILNIVLGLVVGLLQSVLPTLNLGDTGPQLLTLLRGLQPLLSQAIQQVGQALQNLTSLPLAGRR